MSLKGSNNEEKIWNHLKDKGLNDYGIAGLMGNLKAESALNPSNLQNSYEKKLGFTNQTYTEAVNKGTYNNFIRDTAGYGLAQWTYWTRKQNLLNFARARHVSISDLEMQLDFLYKELSEGYKGVLHILKTAKSIREASDVVLTKFERPANQGVLMQIKRANYGKAYYNKYANKESKDKIKKGDKIKVINAITYDGKPFKAYYKEYDVIQVSDDKIVIGIGKTITAAINIKDIKKI